MSAYALHLIKTSVACNNTYILATIIQQYIIAYLTVLHTCIAFACYFLAYVTASQFIFFLSTLPHTHTPSICVHMPYLFNQAWPQPVPQLFNQAWPQPVPYFFIQARPQPVIHYHWEVWVFVLCTVGRFYHLYFLGVVFMCPPR